MSIPQSFLQELLARADVVEIVGRFVPLKKAGANFIGLCPFHGEKSPSFSVSPAKQFYHCFGCGKNGDAISFLMEHTGMEFVEAVKDLAGQYGMQVPQEDSSPQERERAAGLREKQSTLTGVLEKAGDAYRKHLKTSPQAIAYLKGRGLSGEIARTFGLGYAPEGWRSLASVFPDYDEPLLAESGLVIVNEEDDKRYDRFRDRIMFPIRNVKGECIGFGGRVLGSRDASSPGGAGPKYLNSPETPVFSKGRELYGLFEARQAVREHGYVLVTEGYMDVVALAQWGFPNAVATLGTACTTEHVQKLFRFTDRVIFSFDGDAAGRRAARKALEGALPFATDVRTLKFLFLPSEHDPDSYIREFGREAFARHVSEATPLSRFLLEVAQEGCELGSAEGRARAAANARTLWSQLPDGALKRQLLGELAEVVQLERKELAALWGAAPRQSGQARAGSESTGQRAGASPLRPSAARRPAGRVLPSSRADHAARLLLGDAAAWEALSDEVHVMLCGLPPPHGPLFAWLDSQVHEHGPLSWGSLSELLRDHPCGELAFKLMATAQTLGTGVENAAAELPGLMTRMLIERLKVQETEAIAQEALGRYRTLQARRLLLEASLAPSQPK